MINPDAISLFYKDAMPHYIFLIDFLFQWIEMRNKSILFIFESVRKTFFISFLLLLCSPILLSEFNSKGIFLTIKKKRQHTIWSTFSAGSGYEPYVGSLCTLSCGSIPRRWVGQAPQSAERQGCRQTEHAVKTVPWLPKLNSKGRCMEKLPDFWTWQRRADKLMNGAALPFTHGSLVFNTQASGRWGTTSQWELPLGPVCTCHVRGDHTDADKEHQEEKKKERRKKKKKTKGQRKKEKYAQA